MSDTELQQEDQTFVADDATLEDGETSVEQFSISEDIDALMHGEDLSEEFKEKAAVIFEAAVATRLKAEIEKLEEEFETALQEEVDSIKEDLIGKVDGYLSLVVEEWAEANELAIEHGIKNDIMESFIEGMKSVFEQHYIEIPEEKLDVLSDMEEHISEVEEKLSEQINKNIAMRKQLTEMTKLQVVSEAAVGLTQMEAEKFKSLAEDLSFESRDSFASKLQTIKESYFVKQAKKAPITSSVVAEQVVVPTIITEEVVAQEPVAKKETYSPAMAAYLRTFQQ